MQISIDIRPVDQPRQGGKTLVRKCGVLGRKGRTRQFFKLFDIGTGRKYRVGPVAFGVWEQLETIENAFWPEGEKERAIDDLLNAGLIHDGTPEEMPPLQVVTTDNESLDYVDLRPTGRCNLHCSYCSFDSSPRDDGFMSDELLDTVVNQIDALGIPEVHISGGEPLLHPGLFALIERLRPRHLVSLATNGTLVDGEIASALSRLRLANLNVSLDGPDEAVNSLTRGRGSFDSAVRGIRCLIEAGIDPTVICTVTRSNAPHLRPFLALCRDLGVRKIGMNHLWLCGRALQDAAGLPTDDEHERIRESIQDWLPSTRGEICVAENDPVHLTVVDYSYRPILAQVSASRTSFASTDEEGCGLFQCMAGDWALGILPDGAVVACPMAKGFPVGSLLTQPLEEIWLDSPRLNYLRGLRSIYTKSIAVCRDCDHAPRCNGGCRANAFNVFGDWLAPNPQCPVVQAKMDLRGSVKGALDGSAGCRGCQR
jgi:radical SAM protein with 4Fe4S-binding SPASM domain